MQTIKTRVANVSLFDNATSPLRISNIATQGIVIGTVLTEQKGYGGIVFVKVKLSKPIPTTFNVFTGGYYTEAWLRKTDAIIENVEIKATAAKPAIYSNGIGLRLRSQPNTTSTIITTYNKGQFIGLSLAEEDGEFVKVELISKITKGNVDYFRGWVSKKFVSFVSDSTTKSTTNTSTPSKTETTAIGTVLDTEAEQNTKADSHSNRIRFWISGILLGIATILIINPFKKKKKKP